MMEVQLAMQNFLKLLYSIYCHITITLQCKEKEPDKVELCDESLEFQPLLSVHPDTATIIPIYIHYMKNTTKAHAEPPSKPKLPYQGS